MIIPIPSAAAVEFMVYSLLASKFNRLTPVKWLICIFSPIACSEPELANECIRFESAKAGCEFSYCLNFNPNTKGLATKNTDTQLLLRLYLYQNICNKS